MKLLEYEKAPIIAIVIIVACLVYVIGNILYQRTECSERCLRKGADQAMMIDYVCVCIRDKDTGPLFLAEDDE